MSHQKKIHQYNPNPNGNWKLDTARKEGKKKGNNFIVLVFLESVIMKIFKR